MSDRDMVHVGPPKMEGWVSLTVEEYQRLLACERLATAVKDMSRNRGLWHYEEGQDYDEWVLEDLEGGRHGGDTPGEALGIEEEK
ncbi:MAG TPA: hypothetical protein PK406_00775 [Verrucomicrobiota bacterium]|nr:hypothetical protein [Verrucomicrobiota bacterium]